MKRLMITILVGVAALVGMLVLQRTARESAPSKISKTPTLREQATRREISASHTQAEQRGERSGPAHLQESNSSEPASAELPGTDDQSNLGEEDVEELRELIKLAHSEDSVTRERAVGKLLGRIKPGMSKQEVERWLGPPNSLHDSGLVGEAGSVYATYISRSAEWPDHRQLMSVHYRTDKGRDIFIEVRGPHFPWSATSHETGSADTTENVAQRLPQGEESDELERLIVLARSQDAVTREKAIGDLLTWVNPRMSRRHIECRIGPPSTIEDGEALGDAGTVYSAYYCRLPNWPGRQMMTVHYQRDGGTDNFIEVRGPHFPDG